VNSTAGVSAANSVQWLHPGPQPLLLAALPLPLRPPLNGFQLKVPESEAQPLRTSDPNRRPQANKNFTEYGIENSFLDFMLFRGCR